MGEQDQFPHNYCAKTENIEAEIGIDWINALPDSLIVEILCKIPITDACTTTILSKRWHNLWTCIHNLNCYCDCSDDMFISLMDNALPLLTSSKIKNFTLHFRPNLSPSNYTPKLDKWLQIALNKKVEDLHLDVSQFYKFSGYYFDSDLYSLPQDLCSSSSIIKLNCQYCRIPEDCILNWTSLKTLTLTFILLTEEHIQQITSNCHHLESLKLSNFCGFHRLQLTSPKCTRLELIGHLHHINYKGSGDCYFEIVAPYVQHLKISGDFNLVEIRLGELSSLIHADLTCNLSDIRELGEVIEKKPIMKDHLASVACANELIISSLYIEMASVLVLQKEDVSLPLLKCKQLTINSWITSYIFLGIANLLRSTPCLENLTILPEECTAFKSYWCEGIKDLLGDKYKNIFEGSLQNLKTLKVIFQWHIFTDDNTITELTEVMKSLLEHAKNLEKLIIVPVRGGCLKRIENLLALLRVSNTTVVSVESC